MPASAPYRVPPTVSGRTIAFVGRLSPEKGIADFIAAARLLPALPFTVAGDPILIPQLVRTAPPNVRFHGFLSGAALAAFYQDARMLVFPSLWYEGFPNAIGQAMASARPVIASRIGALPEIVEDNLTGLLFDPGNIPMLVERIQHLYDQPETCRDMGQAGRYKLDRDYHPDRGLRPTDGDLCQSHRPGAARPKSPPHPHPCQSGAGVAPP